MTNLIFIVEPSLDYLTERIWESLKLVKVYTKKRGERPDLADPVCLRKGATIEVCCLTTSLRGPPSRDTRMFALVSISRLQPTSDLHLFGE